jgi:hypothetical protein
MSILFLALCPLSSVICLPASADSALDALVAAYPDFLAGYDANDLIWKDGTRMAISDGIANKSFEQLLSQPDIKDQFAIPYPLGSPLKIPAVNEDPGRIRYEPLFLKMYGDCRKSEVQKRLKPVAWMPRHGGGTVSVTAINGVDERLAAAVADLEQLPADMAPFLVPPAGTYNCRPIAGTGRRSTHAFGIAIDISTRFSDYWQWSKAKTAVWTNRIPAAIGDVFERHGFIWGAKWYHFDTMHFEYRPEIIGRQMTGDRRPKSDKQ